MRRLMRLPCKTTKMCIARRTRCLMPKRSSFQPTTMPMLRTLLRRAPSARRFQWRIFSGISVETTMSQTLLVAQRQAMAPTRRSLHPPGYRELCRTCGSQNSPARLCPTALTQFDCQRLLALRCRYANEGVGFPVGRHNIGRDAQAYDPATYSEEAETAALRAADKAMAIDAMVRYRFRRDAAGRIVTDELGVPQRESNTRVGGSRGAPG